jgi:hypothetical protein
MPPELFEALETSEPLVLIVTLLFESTVIAGAPETVIVPVVSTVTSPADEVLSGVVVALLTVVEASAGAEQSVRAVDASASARGLRRNAGRMECIGVIVSDKDRLPDEIAREPAVEGRDRTNLGDRLEARSRRA